MALRGYMYEPLQRVYSSRHGALTRGRLGRLLCFTIPTGHHECPMYNILAFYGQDSHSEPMLLRPAGLYNHVVAPPRPPHGHTSLPIVDVVPVCTASTIRLHGSCPHVYSKFFMKSFFLFFSHAIPRHRTAFRSGVLICTWCGQDDSQRWKPAWSIANPIN